MAFNSSELDIDYGDMGRQIYAFAEQMYPICRSITGQGVRDTLALVQNRIPVKINAIATGTQVFDWVVPKEWNVKDAFIKNSKGEKLVDFNKHNLHLVNYSIPVNKKMSLGELKKHLHSIPEQPDWIPYRTSYYNETWGFCLSQNQLNSLPEDEYEVVIDASLSDGVLNYGEYMLQGDVDDEILFYTHVCHPSLANDNLSGIATLTQLAEILSRHQLHYSYRFVFGPGTIGSISWLSSNEKSLANIRHGLVVALVGDSGKLQYKRNRNTGSKIDRVVCKALEDHAGDYEVLDFSPYGYDERQFCSPGINLDVGRLTRTPNSCYPEYHTSADNLDFIKPDKLGASLNALLNIVNILENDRIYLNTAPKCEPQLGKRGLYDKTGGKKDVNLRSFAMLWVLNQSDGEHSLLDIALRSGLSFELINDVTKDLHESGLLELV